MRFLESIKRMIFGALLCLTIASAIGGCGRPTPVATFSPIAASPVTPTATPSPSPTPTITPAPTSTSTPANTLSSIELVILHTNDTWGYIFPCG